MLAQRTLTGHSRKGSRMFPGRLNVALKGTAAAFMAVTAQVVLTLFV